MNNARPVSGTKTSKAFSRAVAPPPAQPNLLCDAAQNSLKERYANLMAGDCLFYHTLQLPDGTLHHGEWDLRGHEREYLGAFNLAGKRVLEVGPASGALSFAMEKAGAEVVALDLPPGSTPVLVSSGRIDGGEYQPAWIDHVIQVQNAWWYAHRQFGSKAKAVRADVMTALPPGLGRFDVAVFAAILLHLPDPFAALRQVAALTDEAIIVTDLTPPWAQEGVPLMAFNPTPPPIGDVHWWSLSPAAVQQMLAVLGFSEQDVRHHRQRHGLADRSGQPDAAFFTVVGRRPSAVHAALKNGRRHKTATKPPAAIEMPGTAPDKTLPPPDLRFAVAGTSDIASFESLGRKAHDAIRTTLLGQGIDPASLGAVLDFGCGAGRVIRHWPQNPAVRLHGADFNPQMVDWCRNNLPQASFDHNPLEGPLPYADGSFGLVYALSVFTHLPITLQQKWLSELMRVLRPGGCLYLTFHGDSAISALDEALRLRYLQGDIVVTGEETPGTNHCAAFHPLAYVEREFLAPRGLNLLAFTPEGALGNPPQDSYLIRKNGTVTLDRPNMPDRPSMRDAKPAMSGATDRGVNFMGPVTIVSGLGQAGRGYLAALAGADIALRVLPASEGFNHQQTVALDLPAPPADPFAVSLVQMNADATGLALSSFPGEFAEPRYRIGLWVWELASFPSTWHDCIARYDEIWVPSSFCQRAIAAQSSRPVCLMPYVVTTSPEATRGMRDRIGVPAGSTVFLYIFDASSYLARKNPRALVEAFIAEFGDEPGATLVLKTSYADPANKDMNQLRSMIASHTNIRLIEGVLSQADVAGLIEAADCYVSPHRSEGFGLTIAEAMLRAKPVIATAYSGPADFLSEETGFPLPYRLREIESSIGPYQAGYVWAEPDRAELQRLLRRVKQAPDQARRRGAAGQKFVSENYSTAAIGEKLSNRLETIWHQNGRMLRAHRR